MYFLNVICIENNMIRPDDISDCQSSGLNRKIEKMLSDTDWNSNLDQCDADRLHDWALSTLATHSVVAHTMPTSNDASDYLEEKMTHVENVLAEINEIVGKRKKAHASSPSSKEDEKELRFNFHIILSNMRLLTNSRTNPYQVKRAVRVAQTFAMMSLDQLFAEMFALVENTRGITFTIDAV